MMNVMFYVDPLFKFTLAILVSLVIYWYLEDNYVPQFRLPSIVKNFLYPEVKLTPVGRQIGPGATAHK
ncbi:unnamed protein product [Mucor hiemalis]